MRISLVNIKELEPTAIEQIEKIYMDSFPLNERVPFSYLTAKTDRFEMHGMLGICLYKEVIGMLSFIKEQQYVFGMYLAVSKNMNSKGIGSTTLQLFHTKFPNATYIYEIEKPTDAMTNKRVNFYERNGCKMNDFGYLLPPLQKGNIPLPMLLGTYPHTISQEEYNKIRNILYYKIYMVKQ